MAIVFYIPAVLLGAISAAIVMSMGGSVLLAMLVYAMGGALGIIGLALVVHYRSFARGRESQTVSLSWPGGAAVHGAAAAMISRQE